MENVSLLFTFLLGCSLVCSQAVHSRVPVERTFHPDRTYPPAGWTPVARVSSTDTIELLFALKHEKKNLMEEELYRISDPQNEQYGSHWTLKQVVREFAPNKDSVRRVRSWLSSQIPGQHEITCTRGNEWIILRVPATVAESMLDVHFYNFKHDQVQQPVLLKRSIEGIYTLPEGIADDVAFIGGVTHFPRVEQVRPLPRNARGIPQAKESKAKRALFVDPSVLRGVYNVSSASGKAKNNLQAVAQFLGQYYSTVDLQEFFLLYDEANLGREVEKVIGPDDLGAGVEASLDIEYIMAMGSKIRTWFYSTPGLHEGQEPFLTWALTVNNETTIPYTISVSYGDDENSLSKEYTDRVNEEFMKLGLRGTSVLFASGDSGVGGAFENCNKFVPSFPATSPYVTAVGGTTLDGVFTDYEVANSISGGGFSFYYAQPEWQEKYVKAYLEDPGIAKELPAKSYYNTSGRAYPDVSALSSNFLVVANLLTLPVAGTSCAAPTFTGIVSLLNDLRIQQNKSSLGFLNPFVYQTAATVHGAFFDVTEGFNPGCGTNGFPATKGWDPTTGVGTPNYAVLAREMLK